STKIEVDKTADYEQMLGEVYNILQHYYYDSRHHNLNWRATYESYLPVLKQVREDRDFYDYANMMIGHLNSSHTGIRAPRSGGTELPSGHIGAFFDFSGQNIKIGKIFKDGPLYEHRESVNEGDELIEIEGESVNSGQNIWQKLNGKIGKRLKLTFRNTSTGENSEVALKPVSGGAENRLQLEEWIQSRKDMVKEGTDDDIAYLYMRAMGMGDLRRFLLELERDAVPRKGLILDLRWNNGGNVHDRVLEALTKPVYAKWTVRGMAETNQSSYGFADKPIILITNERTLSDGEMTTAGFMALNRGKVVGNTTYGWLIFTTSHGLMNGGSFRLPFWGCYTLDGQDLETNGGIKPDILIINDLNHDLNGQDPQLDKAIEEILKEIRKR
ncbi:S41 family peptidase, partial [candidate division KSB1 bacterium]